MWVLAGFDCVVPFDASDLTDLTPFECVPAWVRDCLSAWYLAFGCFFYRVVACARLHLTGLTCRVWPVLTPVTDRP